MTEGGGDEAVVDGAISVGIAAAGWVRDALAVGVALAAMVGSVAMSIAATTVRGTVSVGGALDGGVAKGEGCRRSCPTSSSYCTRAWPPDPGD